MSFVILTLSNAPLNRDVTCLTSVSCDANTISHSKLVLPPRAPVITSVSCDAYSYLTQQLARQQLQVLSSCHAIPLPVITTRVSCLAIPHLSQHLPSCDSSTRVMPPPHLSRHLPPSCHAPTPVTRAPVRSERQHRNACRWD